MDKKYNDVALEVLQDMFALYLCFKTQSKIKNIYIQELYGYIEVYFYSVFLHELIRAELIEKQHIDKNVERLIQELRMRFLKVKAKETGEHINKIYDEMGIEFERFMYDLILTVDQKDNTNLYSISFGLWDLATMKKDKVLLFNSLAQMPEKIIEGIFKQYDDEVLSRDVLDKIEKICENKAKEVERTISPVKYPYPSGVLFRNPELCRQDKFLILYHYSYFKLFQIVDTLIPNFKVEVGNLCIDVSCALKKLKAMLIGQFGEDIKELDTDMVKDIKQNLAENIHEKDIFKINRRLRTNLHYSEIKNIEQEEWGKIQVFQKQYFEVVLKIFEKNLRFKFGKWYRFIRWIADHTDSEMREKRKEMKRNS